MKAKQIEKLLSGVIKNFLESVKDSAIRDIIKNNSYVTGGCIPSMLSKDFVNDFDIYFYTTEQANAVKDYFGSSHTNNKDEKFHVNLITDNSVNLSDKIQLIIKFVGDPIFVTEKFDWQHIKSWYDCKEEKLHLTPDVYQLVVEKELIYTGSEYPLSSLLRLRKYIKKGWSVSNATILHIALEVVASFNNLEHIRKHEQEKRKSLKKHTANNQEDIEEENDVHFLSELPVLTDLAIFNVDDIIYHLNGVDPLTIQKELQEKTGQYKSIQEIISMVKR